MVVGDRIDRYRIEAMLGQGGMGSVYRAYDEKLHRSVALKVLLLDKEGTHTAERKARMVREARAAAALHHPNCVAIYDVGEHDGAPYIAMELVPGRSLGALQKAPAYAWDERVRWLGDIGRALSAAHRAGLVHRDIKPDNVMLGNDGVIKVLDFGIARRVSRDVDASGPTDIEGLGTLTAEGTVIGTPLYMAPEQIRGGEIDSRADQFAWAVLGWELLGGRSPWPTRDMMILVAAICGDEPLPIELPAGCPRAIEVALRRALSKAPGDRFATMEDAVAAITSPIDASLDKTELAPAPVPPPPGPPPSRSRARTIAAAAVIVALAIGVEIVTTRPLGLSAPHQVAGGDSGAVAAPAATRIIDLPPPKSASPEAVAEYRTGLQALRDASWKVADAAFLRATVLDPNMANAHLRAAFTARYNQPAEVTRHFARATDLRGSLSERDRLFLAALEPLLAIEPPDDAESVKRIAVAEAAFPGDAELVGLHAYVGRAVIGNEPALELARRSIKLDPEFADGWQMVGDIEGDLGHMSEAREALQRCIEISPASIDCRSHLSMLDELEGKCDRVQLGLRAMISRQPEGAATSFPFWPSSLLAIGATREAVLQALEQRWSMLPETQREVTKRMEAAQLDAFYGDFVSALRKVGDVEELIKTSPDPHLHVAATALRVDIESEMGRSSDAAEHAARHLKQREAWNVIAPGDGPDATPQLLYVAYRGGLIDHAQLASSRAAWMERTRSVARPSRAWARGFGASETLEEAREARTALPPSGLPVSYFRHADEAAGVGRILLLTGAQKDGAALLGIAAGSCRGLLDPIAHTRANDALGRAREAIGDTAGACAAYKVVRDRWGKANPKSVTAEHARAQSKSMGCGD